MFCSRTDDFENVHRTSSPVVPCLGGAKHRFFLQFSHSLGFSPRSLSLGKFQLPRSLSWLVSRPAELPVCVPLVLSPAFLAFLRFSGLPGNRIFRVAGSLWRDTRARDTLSRRRRKPQVSVLPDTEARMHSTACPQCPFLHLQPRPCLGGLVSREQNFSLARRGTAGLSRRFGPLFRRKGARATAVGSTAGGPSGGSSRSPSSCPGPPLRPRPLLRSDKSLCPALCVGEASARFWERRLLFFLANARRRMCVARDTSGITCFASFLARFSVCCPGIPRLHSFPASAFCPG